MNKKMYLEVRKAINRRNFDFITTLVGKFPPLSQMYSQDERYWVLLIKAELLRSEENYQNAKLKLEDALNILPYVSLNEIERASVYGRYAFCLYKLKLCKEALSYYEKSRKLTKSDIGRNHFYSLMTLKCLKEMKEFEIFLLELKEIIITTLASSIPDLKYNIGFIGEIVLIVKQSKLLSEVEDIVQNTSLFSGSKFSQTLKNFFLARLAHASNNYARLVHTKDICINSLSSTWPVSQKLQILNNMVSMFKSPFGDFSTASDLLEVALLLTDVNRSDWRVYILNSLGSIMRFKGNYNEAIKYLNESVRICNQHNFTWPLGFAHNTLGMIYTLIGEYHIAQNHFEISLDLNSKKNKNFIGLGYTFGSMAWLESVQGNFSKANELYSKSISSFKVSSHPPSIILLTKAIILSQLPSEYESEIKELLAEAKKRIWKKKTILDKGRYFISLGNIDFNRNKLFQSEENFMEALKITDTFEVKTQGLLGITKVRTDLFFHTDKTEHILKVRECLRELKDIIQEEKSILGLEVKFISAILDMYEGDLEGAEEKIRSLLLYTKENSLTKLNSQISKQFQTLSIYQTQEKIEKQVEGSHTDVDIKSQSLEDIIKYLKEMTNIFHSYDSKNVLDNDSTQKNQN